MSAADQALAQTRTISTIRKFGVRGLGGKP